MKIDSYTIFKLRNLLKFAIFSEVIFFLMIQIIIGKSFTIADASFSFLYGFSVGLIYQITNTTRFYKKSFLIRNTLRGGLLVFSTVGLLFGLKYLFTEVLFISSGFQLDIQSQDFYHLMLSIFIITFFLVLFIELERHLGNRFILHFFLSKYKRPVEEDRVVMFLDLKDSTTIAEKLGNKAFVSFINFCFSVMTKPVIRHKATILKYVGDEVILTWPKRKGIKNDNCVNFYFDFFDELEKHKQDFVEKYGVFPMFKAGLHVGEVTAAYIGSVKKQMDYSGDVMNTAARIQSVCNDFESNFLISKELSELLSHNDTIVYSDIGSVELKGKMEKVAIKRVQRL